MLNYIWLALVLPAVAIGGWNDRFKDLTGGALDGETFSRTAILRALAEDLEQFDMVVYLDRELERNMIYGINLRASMDAEQIARSLEDLVDNHPHLINWERFKDLSEESWGEVAWSEICWNLG